MGIELKGSSAITEDLLSNCRRQATAAPERRALDNAVRKNGLDAVALDQERLNAMQHTFSHLVKGGPITNQKQSGRCWMFAGLNALRVPVMERLDLETFELSQTYQMFWDKLEKSNYFLSSILETLDEPLDGRLVAWLLDHPLQDGGQWDMFVNLVEKYGVVPKWVMPETFHSSQSRRMNQVLTAKLRESAARLRDLHAGGAGASALQAEKERILGQVYGALVTFLGEPPAAFDFECRSKDGTFQREAGITPKEFYDRFVGLDLGQYVSLINAPTADKPYGRTFTVRYLGNVKGGREVLYLNVPPAALRQAALTQLLAGEVVWFGCDVGKMEERDAGVLAEGLYDYATVLGMPLGMSKAQRLDYGESQMTHAMVFTGVNLVDGRPNRWRVENSWGTEPGDKGFFVMSDEWFDAYMYQVVVDRRHLPEDLVRALAQAPIELEPWDPMGALAR
jgi:bleomycin hydrolase